MPDGGAGPTGPGDSWSDPDDRKDMLPGEPSRHTVGNNATTNGGKDEGDRGRDAAAIGAKSGAGPFQGGTQHAIESRRVGETWVKGIVSVIPGASLFMKAADYARSKGLQVTEVMDDPTMGSTGKGKDLKAAEDGARVRASVTAARRNEEDEPEATLGSASLASRVGYSTGNRRSGLFGLLGG